jgi:hypothetical protein
MPQWLHQSASHAALPCHATHNGRSIYPEANSRATGENAEIKINTAPVRRLYIYQARRGVHFIKLVLGIRHRNLWFGRSWLQRRWASRNWRRRWGRKRDHRWQALQFGGNEAWSERDLQRPSISHSLHPEGERERDGWRRKKNKREPRARQHSPQKTKRLHPRSLAAFLLLLLWAFLEERWAGGSSMSSCFCERGSLNEEARSVKGTKQNPAR